jgi:myo-inositol 2-dehydrogenase / D-chiro-inositol 1-dehydrogenase
MKRKSSSRDQMSRRNFLGVAAAGVALPLIIPSRLLGAEAPSNRLRVAQIGCGRIGHDMDMPGVLGCGDLADYVAVCDYDSKRSAHAKAFIEGHYQKKGKAAPKIDVYGDYHEILARSDIDAVVISTPDHQHAEPAAAAALAGKDIWLQKPLAMAVAESRACCDTVMNAKRILQVGSQQRSWPAGQFRKACEYVRGGRVGKLTHIEIGLPKDETKPDDPEQPIPANFNYDAWLGSTPNAYYTEQRCHSQHEISKIRPGWLRNEDHTLGMITGWGSHHYDIAHWGMGIVEGGPEKVEGTAEFPTNKIWNVHLAYHVKLIYPGGIIVNVSDKYPNGVRFIGEEGWIFCSRGAEKASASDPTSGALTLKALDASDPKLITGTVDVQLYKSTNHHRNWLECIKTREQPIAPVSNGHYVFTACAVSWIAMKLKRPLMWDSKAEKFIGDDEANAMLRRAERPGYGIFNFLAKQKA